MYQQILAILKSLVLPAVLFVGLFVPQVVRAAAFYTVDAIHKDNPGLWKREISYIIGGPGEQPPTALDLARDKAKEIMNDPDILKVRIMRTSDIAGSTDQLIWESPWLPSERSQDMGPIGPTPPQGPQLESKPDPLPPDVFRLPPGKNIFDEANKRYKDWRIFNPPSLKLPTTNSPAPKSSFLQKPATKAAPSALPVPDSRFGYDNSLPKLPAPKGVSMGLGINRGTLKRSEAPPSLIDAIRAGKQ